MNKHNDLDSFPIKNFLDTNIQTIKDNEAARSRSLKGLSTGFFYLDRLTKGLRDSSLVVLAGYRESGKTALALNIARNISVDMEVPTLIFTPNIPGEQLSFRLFKMEARSSFTIGSSGQLKTQDWVKLELASQALSKAPLYLDCSPLISMDYIHETATGLSKEFGIKLIIIDYSQLIEGACSQLEQVSRSLKQLAMDLAIPVMVLLRLEGKSELQEDDLLKDRFDRLIDCSGNGNLPQYGDLLIVIRKTPESDDHEILSREIHVIKNKMGTTGMVKLKYDFCGCFQEF